MRILVQRQLLKPQQVRRLSSYFSQSHEYVKVDGEIGTVGITSHAASELGDIVFVDLPSVGDAVTSGEAFGAVESVKAASDVYAPVSGIVTEINEALEETPSLVNDSAFDDGWFIKIKLTDDAVKNGNDLMSSDDYDKMIAN